MALAALCCSGLSSHAGAQESEALRLAFDECEAAVATEPGYDTYRCFYNTGRRAQIAGLDAASLRLEAHRSRTGAAHWPELMLGMVSTVRRDAAPEKVRWFDAAASGFAALPAGAGREPVGELVARANLYRIFVSLDEPDRVAEQVALGRAALEGSETSPSYEEAVVRVAVLEARHARILGVNLGRTHRELERAAQWVFPDGPEGLQRTVLGDLGSLSLTLGRTDDAIVAFERLLEIQERRGAVSSELLVRLDILNAKLVAAERQPADADRVALEQLAADIAMDAKQSSVGIVEARASALQASLNEAGQEDLAMLLFDRCLEIAGSEAHPWLEVECQVQAARRLAASDPERARSALDRAFEIMGSSPNLIYETYVWQAVLNTALLGEVGTERSQGSRLTESTAISHGSVPVAAAASAFGALGGDTEIVLSSGALSVGLQALDEIERMREAQLEAGVRMEVLANWVQDYRFLIGSLLKEGDNEAAALQVTERMRARSLLETLMLADVGGEGRSSPSGDAHFEEGQTEVRALDLKRMDGEIEKVQRQIVDLEAESDSADGRTGTEVDVRSGVDSGRDGARRRGAELFEELERLEREREGLVAGDGQAVPGSVAGRAASQGVGQGSSRDLKLSDRADLNELAGRADLADLREVQAHLAEDEMLLSFSVGLDRDLYGHPGGGGWAIGITRDRAFSWPVSGQERLETVVPLYVAAIESGAGELSTSVALYRLLLDGLEERGGLGAGILEGVRKLVVVPDGVLHHLPFGALRSAAEEEPLAARFELSVAPSVSLWLRWRSGERSVLRGALVLADPQAAGGILGSPNDPGASGVRLEPLRFAREEGRQACRSLGAECRLLVGAEASEATLRQADLSGVGLIHFASHAFVDATYPERSAVVLAANSGSDDGLLQPREIAALDLSHRAVVLSACQTAGGRVAGGEGVLSLARAFFVAGADAVLASRWKIGDREAQELVGWFHQSLATGTTMAEALRVARAQAIGNDMSPAAWASFVVLGDGDLRVGAREPNSRARWQGPAAVALAGTLTLLFIVMMRGRRAS